MNDIAFSEKFEEFIKLAINNLKRNEWDNAYSSITNAMNINPDAPEPHNLFGIWYEFQGKDELARKHYRIAYVLNPIYKPASENLERISTLFPFKKIPINYGDEYNHDAENIKAD